MSTIHVEQTSAPQINGHPHQSPPSSGGGFTAVNGFANKPTQPSSNNVDDATSPRRESHPRQHSIPDANAQSSKTNSNRSSPTMISVQRQRLSSSESTHSSPIRKRSHPEAFSDRDDSLTPKKERGSEDRRANSTEGEAGYAQSNHHQQNAEESEEQKLAAEALRRRDSDPSRRESAMSNGDDRSYADYEVTRAGIILEHDRKKRKRVFSNRTKTGCMTCRKRKKKCDEAHPECNNCLRGGFVCEGYSTRNTWQKPNASKTPVLLQIKESPSTYQHTISQVLPPGAASQVPPSGTSNPGRYPEEHLAQSNIKSIDEPPRLSPHTEPRAWSSHGTATSSSPYGPPQPPQQQASTPYADRSLETRPTLSKPDGPHELQQEPPPYSSLTMSQRPSISGPSAPHHQSTLHGPPPLPLPPSTSMAPPLLDSSSQRPASHHRQESERDKMLRGEYFLPYTPALMADREQCALAVWRFNNSTNPAMGVKLEERMNFFKDIVSLRPTHDSSAPPGPPDPNDPPIVGSVGHGVIVEAPFSCDYGYNITIGNDVVIGADCRITDTCSVHIGNNVVFSPGVRLMCATYAIDPKERKKGKGRALGRQIVIDDDVWIGSNVIILPGVKIGRCTTIGAGSLLHKDVPPYVVVAGNPPKVVRGIYDDGRAS